MSSPQWGCLRRFTSCVFALIILLGLRESLFPNLQPFALEEDNNHFFAGNQAQNNTLKQVMTLSIDQHGTPAIEFALSQANASGATLRELQDRLQLTMAESFYRKMSPFCVFLSGRHRVLPQTPTTPLTVQINLHCEQLFSEMKTGTGNVLILLYGMRLSARTVGNIHLLMTCVDADLEKNHLVTPWIMGWFPATGAAPRPSIAEACQNFHNLPIQYMIPDMQYELQRMAQALVGKTKDSLPHPSRAVLQLPTAPSSPTSPIELDQAVIHFRCGDLLTHGHKKYSFFKFHIYKDIISPAAQSIGIVTQPFAGQNREIDLRSVSQNVERCRVVVGALQNYLQAAFPRAQVSIRNGPQENLALSFSRMIMANQTIASVSSFSLFPALATVGMGYIPEPDAAEDSASHFLLEPRVDGLSSRVVLFPVPQLLPSIKLVESWDNGGEASILEWFRNENVTEVDLPS